MRFARQRREREKTADDAIIGATNKKLQFPVFLNLFLFSPLIIFHRDIEEVTHKMKFILLIPMVFVGAMAAPWHTNDTLRPSEYPTLIFRRSGLNIPLECAVKNSRYVLPFSCRSKLIRNKKGQRHYGRPPLADSVIDEIR